MEWSAFFGGMVGGAIAWVALVAGEYQLRRHQRLKAVERAWLESGRS